MAFRRNFRRRKAPVLWFPNTGNSTTVNESNWLDLALTVPGGSVAGQWFTSLAALTWDFINEEGVTGLQSTLAANAVRLKRIVGNLFISRRQATAEESFAFKVHAGLILLRSEETSGAPDFIAAATQTAAAITARYSPAWKGGERAPWIWNRSWILTNPSSTAVLSTTHNGILKYAVTDYEGSNGAKIDQKTARKIDLSSERLNLVVSAGPVDSVANAVNTNFDISFQYRLLGSPARGTVGNRGNASY